jgi:hypothetical protein
MYFSEWIQVLEERLKKIRRRKNKTQDYEHYPQELV